MSKRKQLEKFNPDFVSATMDHWVKTSLYYQREAENAYTKLRSYLTMYQFRLTDQQKHEIREKLSAELDKIDNNDQVDDLDSYLDGFCFKLDTSILATKTESQSAPTPEPMIIEPATPQTSVTTDIDMHSVTSDTAIDHNDLDIYTMQFFQ